MDKITHCHNQRPVYETGDKNIFEWQDPMAVSGENYQPTEVNYFPFIFDIETSAELGQRPILCVGYNTLEDRLIVLYSHGHSGYELTLNRLKELCPKPKKYTLHNLSISNFEKYFLWPIAEWNARARERKDKNRLSLVAHNAPFDIPMMGTPDDDLLDNPRIGDQYEQSVQYKTIKMVSHRAGQFGQIYTFLDSSNHYKPLHIPVGDTLVTAKSLWVPGKLKSACEKMNVELEVSESETHGELSDTYLEYCINDVMATYELYNKFSKRIRNMFGDLPIEHIYSTASIGKFVLRKMGYKRPGYEMEAVDRIVPAYFGGRTDANITGEIVENLRYTDILSEYPTVSKLTNVWEFMKAEYVGIEKINKSELPTDLDMSKPENWQRVANYYVKIKPNGATLPVRTPHLDETTKVVTAKVESSEAMQYHYMDVISSKLIDNDNDIEIVGAWRIVKNGSQELTGTTIAGVDISPEDNVMSKTIESRKIITIEVGKNSRTNCLKIVGNSLYGVSAERIVKDTDNGRHDYASEKGFYNPHVATTITAGGRLMLALGERAAIDNGGELVYCDTDSFIIPDKCANAVIDTFKDLNPYGGKAGTLDVLEDEKGEVGNLYAVGTKKYIFFNNEGEVLEYKEHGLGNYDNLRGKDSDGYDIIKRLWATIIYYDKEKKPLNVPILYDGKLNKLVIWSFTASTRSMREMIDEFTSDYVYYGDWVQSTLSYDDSIRYIALNLMEKDDNDSVVRVTTNEEDLQKIEEVSKVDMENDSRLKTIKDVVMKFVMDASEPDYIPEVYVTDFKIVTKEATSRTDIFISKLENQFDKNMKIANKILFGQDLIGARSD